MWALAMRWIPKAAASTVMPSGPAIESRIARAAASAETTTSPAANGPLRMKPKTTLASVTVGSWPPARSRPGRAGLRTARATVQAAGGIDPGQASSAGANFGDIERGGQNHFTSTAHQPVAGRQLAAPTSYSLLVGHAAVFHQASFCGRAPHVEAEQLVHAHLQAHVPGGQHSGGWTVSSTKTGRSAASAAGVNPPADCIISSGAAMSRWRSPAARSARYRSMTGARRH